MIRRLFLAMTATLMVAATGMIASAQTNDDGALQITVAGVLLRCAGYFVLCSD